MRLNHGMNSRVTARAPSGEECESLGPVENWGTSMSASGRSAAMASKRSNIPTLFASRANPVVGQCAQARALLVASGEVSALTSGGVDIPMKRMFGFARIVASRSLKCRLYDSRCSRVGDRRGGVQDRPLAVSAVSGFVPV
jgi:hypothetical protein